MDLGHSSRSIVQLVCVVREPVWICGTWLDCDSNVFFSGLPRACCFTIVDCYEILETILNSNKRLNVAIVDLKHVARKENVPSFAQVGPCTPLVLNASKPNILLSIK